MKTKKIFITFSFLLFANCFLSTISFAQSPNWLWAKSAGMNNYGSGIGFLPNKSDEAHSVTVDASGNSYVAGSFSSDSITFGSITLINSSGSGWNSGTMFIVKYDVAGNILWAKSAVGASDATALTTDASGNIYVAGNYRGTSVTFGSITLNNVINYYSDIFLVKYDASGNVLWAKSAGGDSDDLATSVTVDASGNACVAGYFGSSSITFNSITLNNIVNIAGNNYDIFIAKYDTNGNLLWAKNAGGSSNDEASSVTADISGNVYVTGSFVSSSITFGSTTLINTSSGAYNSDMFIAKYDASGNVIWAKSTGGDSNQEGASITADASGNVYATGIFYSLAITFGSTTLYNIIQSSFGSSSDMFVVKYDASGNVLWAKSAGGNNLDGSASLTADASGNIYIAGYSYSPSVTFGSINLNNAGSVNMFIVKYDAGGNALWAKSTGENGEAAAAADASGNVYMAGYFNNPTITFGSITLNNTDTTGSTVDMFIAKLASTNTEIENIENIAGINIFPNPSNGKFGIEMNNQQLAADLMNLEIYNSLGEKIYQVAIQTPESTIDISNQPSGIYFLNIKTEKESFSQKLIIQK